MRQRRDAGRHRVTGRPGVVAAVVVGAVASVVASPVGDSTAAVPTGASALVALAPMRLADTRERPCGCERVDDRTIRVEIADTAAASGVEGDVVAAAITVTALPTAADGFVTVWPSGAQRPLVSTANTRPDRVVANAAVVPIGADGSIDVYRLVDGDVVIDLSAVFVATAATAAGRFIPLAPIRVADTRTSAPPAGALAPGGELVIALPPGVAADASALATNITSVGETAPGHVSVRPAGAPPATTSVLNTTGSGAAVAASTIVPVSDGGFVISSFGGGDVVVDVVGWFTGPSAPVSSDGLFVPIAPTRLVDTRDRPERLHPAGTIEIAPPVAVAAAVVSNVTAVAPDAAGYVTAHPAGTSVPATSTVNPSFWNHTVANFAITGTSERGLAYTSLRGTDLVVDASGWFTGPSVRATDPPPPNAWRPPRMLVVGDSTLGGVVLVPGSAEAFVGVDAVVDAAPCRRLLRPSCTSDIALITPNTAVEAIAAAAGSFDIVAIKTGYNDWFSDFPAAFDAVVGAARSKGAHTVLWMSYNEDRVSAGAHRAFAANNADLRRLAALPQYPDVLVADWLTYSRTRADWFWDGTHLTPDGAYAVTDYLARWAAAIEHRPCPRPWVAGGPVVDPCVPPEWIGPVADPRRL